MKRPIAPEQAESSRSSSLLRAARGKIAMLGLIGAAALPTSLQACKVSLSAELIMANKAREDAVDKDGAKIISVPNMDTMIILGSYEVKVEDNDVKKIKGLMHISDISPLQTLPENIREIQLPKDAHPWVRMVVEKSGRITLRTEDNLVALNFNCTGLGQGQTMSCYGKEIKPEELDAQIAQGTSQYEIDRLNAVKDAGADVDADTKTDAGDADAGVTTTEAGPKDAGSDTDASDADAGATKTDAAPQDAEVDRPAFLSLINAERKKRGAKPVEIHQCPSSMAEYWAKKPGAAAGGYVADGETPITRLEKFQCKGPVAEIVDYPAQIDAARIFEQWKADQKKLTIMVDKRIKKIGLHCVSGTGVENGNFCVMDGTSD
jgi:uncharacterized protein YkwD